MYQFPENFHRLSDDFLKLYFKPTPKVIIEDQIIVVEKFFSEKFCDELIRSLENSPDVNLETTPLIKSKEYAARYNDRFLTTDFQATTSLWNYLRKVLMQDVGYEDEELELIKDNFSDAIFLNPQLRIYRYQKGHHFGKHYDESVKCPVENKSKPKIGKTKWTLLIYLTGGKEFVGGGTIFYPRKALNIHPTKGMALLHKHGDDCLQHEAEIVKQGVKWVLRSDVVY